MEEIGKWIAYAIPFLVLSISIWSVAWKIGRRLDSALEEKEKKCYTQKDKCENEFKTYLKTSIYESRRSELTASLNQRFDGIDKRIDSMDHRMELGFGKLDAINLMLQGIGAKLNK